MRHRCRSVVVVMLQSRCPRVNPVPFSSYCTVLSIAHCSQVDPSTIVSVAVACAMACKPNRSRRLIAEAEEIMTRAPQPFLFEDREVPVHTRMPLGISLASPMFRSSCTYCMPLLNTVYQYWCLSVPYSHRFDVPKTRMHRKS